MRRALDATYPGNKAKADAVARVVDDLGLVAFLPPLPLPPIAAEEIHLICWMAVEAESK